MLTRSQDSFSPIFRHWAKLFSEMRDGSGREARSAPRRSRLNVCLETLVWRSPRYMVLVHVAVDGCWLQWRWAVYWRLLTLKSWQLTAGDKVREGEREKNKRKSKTLLSFLTKYADETNSIRKSASYKKMFFWHLPWAYELMVLWGHSSLLRERENRVSCLHGAWCLYLVCVDSTYCVEAGGGEKGMLLSITDNRQHSSQKLFSHLQQR